MNNEMKTTSTISLHGRAVALTLMVLGALVMVYPYAYMVGSSVKTRKEFAEDKTSLIPSRYQIGEQIAHARGEPSALDWPGADWSVLRIYVEAIVAWACW